MQYTYLRISHLLLKHNKIVLLLDQKTPNVAILYCASS